MAALAGVAPLQRSAAFHKGNMIARDFILALLTLTFVGCSTISVSSDASKWTIELSSSESLPSGPCRIYDEEDRVMLEGTLTSGKMDGTWTSFGSNGDRLAVWSYREGVRSGPVQMWYGPLAYPKGRGCRKLRSEEHTSELQSLAYLVCRLLLEKKKKQPQQVISGSTQAASSVYDLAWTGVPMVQGRASGPCHGAAPSLQTVTVMLLLRVL